MTVLAADNVQGATDNPEDNSDDGKGRASAQNKERVDKITRVFGEIVTILRASPAHRHLFLADLDWLIFPPLLLGQLRVIHHKGRPIGFASWAFLNEETEKLLSNPNFRLHPEHWKSGDRAWIVDLVAPQEVKKSIIEELRSGPLKGSDVQTRDHSFENKADAEVNARRSAE